MLLDDSPRRVGQEDGRLVVCGLLVEVLVEDFDRQVRKLVRKLKVIVLILDLIGYFVKLCTRSAEVFTYV